MADPDGLAQGRLVHGTLGGSAALSGELAQRDVPAAPPLWARFYELGTNRPLYMDRDSQPVYDFSQIDYERRSGYNYHTDAPAALINRYYPAWRLKHPRATS